MKFNGRILTESDKCRFKFYKMHKSKDKLKYLIASIPNTKREIKEFKKRLNDLRKQVTPYLTWGQFESLHSMMTHYRNLVRYHTEVLDWQRACLSDLWTQLKKSIDKQ